MFHQGWIDNRAYRAFSRWADALKNLFFIFYFQGPSRRDSEQPVAHWFVSCIDSVNHPITMRYRRSDEVFCSAYIKIASPQLLPRLLFPRFHSSFYQEQACSVVSDAGQRARQEERRVVESVKYLIGTRNGGSHLTYPYVCVHHECRIRKHFLIKRKFILRNFFGQAKSSVFIEVSMGQ